jgi:hypothetical protein
MGVLAPGSAHARPSAWPPFDTSRNLSAHVSGRGADQIVRRFFSSFFSPNQRILRTFCFFQKKKKKYWGGNIFKIFFIFQKTINCGHYFCLPSTKIVVTMFACHLHSSDQSCVCRITFKHLPQPLISHIRSFGTIFSTKKTKNDLKIAPRGLGGGGPNFIFLSQNCYYFFLGAHAKI